MKNRKTKQYVKKDQDSKHSARCSDVNYNNDYMFMHTYLLIAWLLTPHCGSSSTCYSHRTSASVWQLTRSNHQTKQK